MSAGETGSLFVVATPIGNLEDLSRRAERVLSEVAIIACEDTRRTRRLLSAIGAQRAKLIALHDHNERDQAPAIIETLLAGDDVALVSDAGTPLVSDPGFILLRAAFDAGIRLVPIPGPSAVLAAIAVSPLPVNRFLFEGFLPAKSAQRKERLRSWLGRDFATVFFETPHRVTAMLADLVALGAGDREVVVCRELTKIHEEILVAPVAALAGKIEERGEFVVILPPLRASSTEATDPLPAQVPTDRLLEVLKDELPLGTAARLAARLVDRPRRELYAAMVSRSTGE